MKRPRQNTRKRHTMMEYTLAGLVMRLGGRVTVSKDEIRATDGMKIGIWSESEPDQMVVEVVPMKHDA
jgi:hypothetical protein